MKDGFIMSMVLLFIIGIIVIMEYDLRTQEQLKQREFITWCMEEYRNEPHSNLAQYCVYLYHGKVK